RNVANGTFGSWEETGLCTQLALLAGALNEDGYGRSLGRFIEENGAGLPDAESLEKTLRAEPSHPLTPARAEILMMMRTFGLPAGDLEFQHPWKDNSVLAEGFRRGVPVTVHPGIGYDIIVNHPLYNGAAVGRAADLDFRQLAGAVDALDNGVVLSVGSALLAPQGVEKRMGWGHNLPLPA